MSTLAERVSRLSPEQRLRLAQQMRQRARQESTPEELPLTFPLSHSQWVMWFVHQLAPRSPAYNVAFACRLEARLDVAHLRRAGEILVERHVALRTHFTVAEAPAQTVAARGELDFTALDGCAWSPEELDRQLRRLYERPFTLDQGAQLRLAVVTRGPAEHVLLLVAHHVTLDLWSIAILLGELRVIVPALGAGREPALPPVGADYRSFVRWQNELVAGSEGERLWDYWRSQLAGEPRHFELASDRPRPVVQSFRGATLELAIEAPALLRLRLLARQAGVTLYTLLLAVLQVLLGRYTGRTDVLVGSPMAGRTRAELSRIVGCLINLVVLRGDLGGDLTFRGLLQQLGATVLSAIEHQDLPFSVLSERLEVPRDASRTPLTGVVFSLDKPLFQGGDANAGAGDLSLQPLPFMAQQEGQFDLYLEMAELDDRLVAGLRYATDLFDATTARRLAGHFQTLLAGVLEASDLPISGLPLLTAAEVQALRERNATAFTGLPWASFPARFAEQAQRTPSAVAAVCGDERLSYGELARLVDRLAGALAVRGVGPDVVVALLDERGLDLLTAILAVLAAGGAFLPLDPHHPPARHAQVLAQSGARLVLASAAANARLAALGDPLPRRLPIAAREHPETPWKPACGIAPGDLAYVIYTSGSTGAPKGAMVAHRGMLNHLLAKVSELALGPADALAQNASQCFDISIWQMLAALLVGGRVHILPDEVANDPLRLLDTVDRAGISVLEIVPSLLRTLFDDATRRRLPPRLPALRWLVPTGEALPPDLCDDWLARYPEVPLVNAYGPTECSDDVTHFVIRRPLGDARRVPIGYPLHNTRLYVLDVGLRCRPDGQEGELFVGGDGVGRGYLNAPDLTAAAFLPDPFGEEPGGRLYRTGDRVRAGDDGALLFLGRVDHQAKLRGFRIEMGEIEAVLQTHSDVQAAAVLIREDAPELRQLVAYVVGRTPAGPEIAALRSYVAGLLPDYMVPQVFVPLASLPLTPNGKLDRRALPAPEQDGRETAYAAPRNAAEAQLAAIWADLFARERIGIDDDFFALGGDSVLGIRILARANALGLRLTLRQLFAHPTIAELAGQTAPGTTGLEPGEDASDGDAVGRDELCESQGWAAGEIIDIYPLAPLQQGILFHTLVAPQDGAYLLQCQCELLGPLDPERLGKTWNRLAERHAVLRTSFHHEQLGEPLQAVHRSVELPLVQEDWRGLDDAAQAARLCGLLATDRRRGFALTSAPLVRLTLIRTAEESHQLVATCHHLLLDGWSIGLLLREFLALYAQPLAALSPPPPFHGFVAWQRRHDASAAERFWRAALAGATAGGWPPPAAIATGGEHREQSLRLPATLTAALTAAARRHRLTLNTVLRGLWALLQGQLSGSDDVLFGATIAGRAAELPGVESMVGLLINTLPIRVRTSPGEPLVTWLRRLQDEETTLRPFEHSPLVAMQRWSGKPEGEPLFEVNFVFENYPLDTALRSPAAGLQLGAVRVHERGTYPLTVMVVPGEELLLAMSYDSTRCDDATIGRLLNEYQALIERAAAAPERRAGELILPGPAQRHQILVEWNATATPSWSGPSFLELFAAQVGRTPDAVAVADGRMRLSYRDLDRQAEALAGELEACKLPPEAVVAVIAERGVELLVAMLALFKAGYVYLPIDPQYPAPRQAQVLAESRAALVLAAPALNATLPALLSDVPPERRPPVLPLSLAEGNALGAASPPRQQPTAGLAYVIFTSGSTGVPKGAMVEHTGLLNHLRAKVLDLELTAADVIAQNASQGFDISIWQFLAPLTVGGRVEVVADDAALDPHFLLAELAARGVTILELVPAQLRALLEALAEPAWSGGPPASLRWLLSTGEALPPELCQRWLTDCPRIPLLNAFGPTECSDDVTHHPVRNASEVTGTTVPVGRPIVNTQLYVVDRSLQPTSAGAPGELLVGGAGVGRGYLGDPVKTAAAFVPDPFSAAAAGARLYRTGDLARWRMDGKLEFLGRIDHQVKLAGFRVELAEIEAVVGRHPAVATVVAAVYETAGRKRLAAYVVARQPVQAQELRRFAQDSLPGSMVPAVFVFLERLPLTINGKVDRRALPAPVADRSGEETVYQAPRDEIERLLVGCFAEVLKIERLGVHDSFFELGGHSLLAIQITTRIHRLFQVRLPIRSLFEAPTVAGVAEALRRQEGRPGQLAAIAQLRKQVDGLSPAEVRRLLEERKRRGAPSHHGEGEGGGMPAVSVAEGRHGDS